jgi:hypothetical protein
MSEQANQDSQKTIVAFVAGLLIGGLLVYVFASPTHDEEMHDNGDVDTEMVTPNNSTTSDIEVDLVAEDDTAPEMVTGDGQIRVSDQPAGPTVKIDGATFPNDEGWIGVRDYENEQLGRILGVARFSNEQGLIPTSVELQRSTVAGKVYALVFYTESGDRMFSLADDVQIGDVVSTFTAN